MAKEEQESIHLLVIQDEVRLPDELVRVAGILEGDETETLGSARFAVDHNGTINDLAVLGEERPHRVRRR